jgi:hypothetical protein
MRRILLQEIIGVWGNGSSVPSVPLSNPVGLMYGISQLLSSHKELECSIFLKIRCVCSLDYFAMTAKNLSAC